MRWQDPNGKDLRAELLAKIEAESKDALVWHVDPESIWPVRLQYVWLWFARTVLRRRP